MCVRLLSLLLIAGVFATQLARIPHAHEGMSCAENNAHNQTPHMHLAVHSHSHDHSHHHHDNSDESNRDAQFRSISESHDATAIALSADVGTVNSSCSSDDLAKSILDGLFFVAVTDPKPLLTTRRLQRPLDADAYDFSDIYLTFRQLRI